MHILVTNDDGIFSPGIFALAKAMREIADRVTVVAPDVEQSAMGHAITIRRPLRYQHTTLEPLHIDAYRVDGTPADCVIMGISNAGRPDIVVSGINFGVNIGYDITHSGTVSAAIEAMTFGLPAIAFSLEMVADVDFDFSHVAAYAKTLVPAIASRGLPERTVLNVNFPAQEPKGIQVVRQSTHGYDDNVIKREDPTGKPYYWLTGKARTDENPGTDYAALKAGYATLTPLYLDLTHDALLDSLRETIPPV